ncbi:MULTISPECIES: DNA-methyltransferase [Olivibacter]|uniref:Methyltransferase n=1 Tax=Olivibacter oleidegradans TaxID=760123 RepID=A0ABV6HIB3_9SPHI|nr:site-specific DNA-methyltransferase [Olivibacter jilunii]
MELHLNSIIKGDCLEVMKIIPEGAVDMVLCDLPYGMTRNAWDKQIDLDRLWEQYRRVVKPNGVIALTSQGRFTATLIESNPEWFRYKIVWIKSKASNFLNASRQPLKKHEDICIFYRKSPVYNPQKTIGKPYTGGLRKKNTSDIYGKYGGAYIGSEDGSRYPTDILFYEEEDISDWVYFTTAEKDGSFHPTQKPISLGRWLIRTYSRPGEIVLDNACGSGSFLVSAILENRSFIGIEKNERTYKLGKPVDFIATAWKRIKEARIQASQVDLDHF